MSVIAWVCGHFLSSSTRSGLHLQKCLSLLLALLRLARPACRAAKQIIPRCHKPSTVPVRPPSAVILSFSRSPTVLTALKYSVIKLTRDLFPKSARARAKSCSHQWATSRCVPFPILCYGRNFFAGSSAREHGHDWLLPLLQHIKQRPWVFFRVSVSRSLTHLPEARTFLDILRCAFKYLGRVLLWTRQSSLTEYLMSGRS